MMKSIFLNDSRLLDSNGNGTPTAFNRNTNNPCSGQDSDDYIMVDACDYYVDSEAGGGEEEEYDYCDDAMREGVPGYSCSFAFSLSEDMILEEAEQPSIQHILDEAHESVSQLVSLVSDQEHPDQDRRDQENTTQLNQVPGILESSASDVSVHSSPLSDTPKQESKQPAPTTATAQLQGVLGGRLSNKKRRKKMKLLKKAAAAASAAAALSSELPRSASTTCSNSTKSTKKHTKVVPSTRYQSKRVANVAVACATETLASYKAQLNSSSTK